VYTEGFFNIGVEYPDLFGVNVAPIKVELGDKKNVIDGYLNRTANKNGTPRIMMGIKYTEWVQKVFNQWEYMNVKVLNPNLLHLYKEREGDI
jgi:hypothetical protein